MHEVHVDLPPDQDQITTQELPEFGQLPTYVFRSVKGVASTTAAADLRAVS